MELDQDLADAEAIIAARMEKAEPPPAPAPDLPETESTDSVLLCSFCDKVFKSIQAKGAAVRWCKVEGKPCQCKK